MRSLILFFNLLSTVSGLAQEGHMSAASGFLKLVAYSRIHKDVFSFPANQAALASVRDAGAGLYSERMFMLGELSNHSMALVLPVGSGSFGIGGRYFGPGLYNEFSASLAYGRSLGSMVDVGLQFNYIGLNVRGYGPAGSLSFDAGMILHFTERFHTGVHVQNPTRAGIGTSESEDLPVVYSAGFGFDLSENFFLGAEIEKEENQPASFNPGIHYRPGERLMIRAGICSNTSSFYFGAGFFLKEFRIDAIAAVHPVLGTTPGLSLIYSLKK